MGRRKILHVISTLDQSGAEKQLTLLASHLPRDRFDVAVCALTRGGYYQKQLESAGVKVFVLGKRLQWDPMTLWRLRGVYREFQPNLVQTWLFSANCYGRVAARTAKVPRVVASERCVDSWKRRYQFAIDRQLVRWTDRVVANSEAVRMFYRGVGIPEEKLTVIRNAVPPLNGRIGSTQPGVSLEPWGVQPGEPVLGFVGRLWPQKRVQDLIWALDVLRIAGLSAHLLVIGDGPRRTSLERFTQSLELNHLVHFLGHRSDALELLAKVDLVVVPSKFEGMPNVVLEAMQLGKPVVATRIPGMDEVVEEGRTGLLVEPKQPFELAKAIRQLLLDPQRRVEMGGAGRERVLREFTLESMVERYGGLYDELLG